MIVTKLLNERLFVLTFTLETKLHVFNYFHNNILILIFMQKIIQNYKKLHDIFYDNNHYSI